MNKLTATARSTTSDHKRSGRTADLWAAALVLAVVALVYWAFPVGAQDKPAAAGDAHHRFECSKHAGIARARCERHERMFARCGSVKGEAHFACDREFLVDNPLACDAPALRGGDQAACQAEVAAFKSCHPQQGRDFARCVRSTTSQSPMGPH